MDDIIRMAREAGFTIEGKHTQRIHGYDRDGDYTEEIERLVELVRADERERIIAANATEIEKINAHIKALEAAVLAEREACAKVVEAEWHMFATLDAVKSLANAIRARGQS